MSVRFTINEADFNREIKKSISTKNSAKKIEDNLKAENGELIVKKIEKVKKEMISNFLSLPITREILAGKDSANISGTLGGYGNLFTFIGFNSGERPIDPIISLLNQTNYRITKLNRAGVGRVIIELPSKEQIFKVTPLPWAGGISWAQRMEIGLSGLGMYLNLNKSNDNSRSGKGVQSEKRIRAGKFSNTPYISAFLQKWQKIFSQIDKNISIGGGGSTRL